MPLQLNQFDLELVQAVLVDLFWNRGCVPARFWLTGFLAHLWPYPLAMQSIPLVSIKHLVFAVVFSLAHYFFMRHFAHGHRADALARQNHPPERKRFRVINCLMATPYI